MSSRKILMLHGYGQNAYMMSRYMAAITHDLAGEDVEFQYLDAPFSLTPADLNAAHASLPSPPKSAPVCNIPSTTPAPSDSPRGWFTIVNFGGNTMEGIETSLALLKKTLKENRFEAIMGFSQGAAMAELLVAMLERPDLYPFMADDVGAAVHPPMAYIVAVSGFLLRGPSAAWDGQPVTPAFPSSELTTPVLHVVGSTDFVVPRERTDIFMSLHKNKRVEEHIGGHFVPRQTKWRKFFVNFFSRPFASPLLESAATQRRSGSSTPDSDNGAAVHPPMDYIIAVSGFLLRGPSAAWDGQPVSPAFPSSELTTPVLHVVGNTDFVVPRERADIFMSLHKNKRVEEHIGGHFVPRQTKWRQFFVNFFSQPFAEIASPVLAARDSAATRLPSIREERRSGSSTPDSDGPGTPPEQGFDVKEVDLQLGTSKLLVEEEEARMWDIYTGLVYQD